MDPMRTRVLFFIAALATAAMVFAGCSADDPVKSTNQNPTANADPAKKDPAKVDPPKGAADGADVNAGTTTKEKYTSADKKAAKLQFKTFCATCHGTTGKGDGPAAAGLDPKPRNWTDSAWQKSTTDERIFQVIKDGGPAVGLSPLMTANPLYQDRPGVIHALVRMVRKCDPAK